MEILPSKDAQKLKVGYEEGGISVGARGILSKALPESRWWTIVSRSARSGNPYYSALSELAALMVAEPTYRPWPEALFETDDSLPPITADEGLALLDRFLRADKGGLESGVQMHPLHWDLLAGHYCPLRERFAVLKQLCLSGALLESANGALHQQSALRWPLTVTEEGLRQIRRTRLAARLPTFRRIDDLLADLSISFPMLSKAVPWALLGAGLLKITEWLVSWAVS
jgi:hypothetical protein